MEGLGEGAKVFGLIHGDLNPGNVLVHEDEVAAIDFNDCSWGYYLIDMVIAMERSLKLSEHGTFLSGYQQVYSLPDRFFEHLEILCDAFHLFYRFDPVISG